MLKHAGRRRHQPEALPRGPASLKEKQRIQGRHVIYDKRTGDFEAPGPGTDLALQAQGQGEPKPIPTPSRPPAKARSARGRRHHHEAPAPGTDQDQVHRRDARPVRRRQGPGRRPSPATPSSSGPSRRPTPRSTTRNSDIDFDRLVKSARLRVPDLRRPQRLQLSPAGRLQGRRPGSSSTPGATRPARTVDRLDPGRPDHLRLVHRADLRLRDDGKEVT